MYANVCCLGTLQGRERRAWKESGNGGLGAEAGENRFGIGRLGGGWEGMFGSRDFEEEGCEKWCEQDREFVTLPNTVFVSR